MTTYAATIYTNDGSDPNAHDALDARDYELDLEDARDFARDYRVRVTLATENGDQRFDVDPSGEYSSR